MCPIEQQQEQPQEQQEQPQEQQEQLSGFSDSSYEQYAAIGSRLAALGWLPG